jgi:GNAT superfamily N-acetyltransferase
MTGRRQSQQRQKRRTEGRELRALLDGRRHGIPHRERPCHHPAAIIASVHIRDATSADWGAIWPFFHRILAAGETYSYDRDMDEPTGRRTWMVKAPGRVSVAEDPGDDGVIMGSSSMYPNRGGPGSHVASASFMVDPDRAGRGVGRALGEDMIAWARRSGFRAIQFNAVVESNANAVALWRSLGFEVIGTVPAAFAHPRLGDVGLHVMHRFL